MTMELSESINSIYQIFKDYKINDFKTLTLFDGGPSEKELADLLSNPLRNLSEETMRAMEFFNEGWESWGTKTEVKHFLPRILEIIAARITSSKGDMSHSDQLIWLCKYKLKNCFSDANIQWSKPEKEALLNFFESLAKTMFQKDEKLGYFFEALVLTGVTSDTLKNWWSIENGAIFENQVKGLLSHFQVSSYYPIEKVKPIYANPDDVSTHLISIIEWAFAQLPEQMQQGIVTRAYFD